MIKKQLIPTTLWVNPTVKTVSFKLFGAGRFENISLKPQESIELPSEYDQAVRDLDKSGRVIGGKAPQLEIVGEYPPAQIHAALLDAAASSGSFERPKPAKEPRVPARI